MQHNVIHHRKQKIIQIKAIYIYKTVVSAVLYGCGFRRISKRQLLSLENDEFMKRVV